GLSMPSEKDQRTLLERIYNQDGVPADQVAFVEAHGTGTPVGDPVEARAIGAVIGKAALAPVPIGSAKTNVGHLEAGSGLTGLLKAQLALEKGILPSSLNFGTPNPEIDFDGLNLRVACDATRLPVGPEPLFAGINSFGFGGANGHAVLQRCEEVQRDNVVSLHRRPPLILCARSKNSLSAMAQSWRDGASMKTSDMLEQMAMTSAHCRTRHPHRAVLSGSGDLLDRQLEAVASDRFCQGVATGEAPERAGKTAFIFCGNGAQWPGMGQDLFASDPEFRDAFERVSAAYQPLADTRLIDLLCADPDTLDLSDGLIGQPLLFAIQLALADALRARGFTPDIVAGHSVGEVAAAWTAGAISLPDACKLIHVRASAMRPLKASGTMAAVLQGAADLKALIDEADLDHIEISGDNSPRSTTVSGSVEQIAKLQSHGRARRVAVQKLPVAYAYHSAAMDPIEAAMREGLADLVPAELRLPMVSTETGQLIEGGSLDAGYWWRNARNPVRFREAVAELCALGATTFVEIGPRPLLQAYIKDTASDVGRRVSSTTTMDRGERAPGSIDEMAARILAHGGTPDQRFLGEPPVYPVDLPRYPWNRETFKAEKTSDHVDVLRHVRAHPLLGAPVHSSATVWLARIDAERVPWLSDHVVDGQVMMPATGFVEVALAAGQSLFGPAFQITDFDIVASLPLPASVRMDLRTSVERETGIVRIESRPSLRG
ncbi:MAG: type I polyketide synthase, partial [Pseudomonadota bacterium]